MANRTPATQREAFRLLDPDKVNCWYLRILRAIKEINTENGGNGACIVEVAAHLGGEKSTVSARFNELKGMDYFAYELGQYRGVKFCLKKVGERVPNIPLARRAECFAIFRYVEQAEMQLKLFENQ